ncbi:MAG TPA: hypothetical protein VF444_10030 [Pseudonocardiaceae bacterium]
MATVRVHPLQLEYSLTDGRQTCALCGAEEKWTAAAEPTVRGPRLQRTLHLVHLVREHRDQVSATFAPSERSKETTVSDDVATDEDETEEEETPA